MLPIIINAKHVIQKFQNVSLVNKMDQFAILAKMDIIYHRIKSLVIKMDVKMEKF